MAGHVRATRLFCAIFDALTPPGEHRDGTPFGFFSIASVTAIGLIACSSEADRAAEATLDEELLDELAERGFTGRIEAALEARLGRLIDPLWGGSAIVLRTT